MAEIKKKDRRIEKTQKSIRDAFLNLIMEKDISQITIKELSEQANINRKTFYMHYASISAILESIENEIMDNLLSILNNYDFFDEQFTPYSLFRSLNDIIDSDFDLYQKLVFAKDNNFLLNKVKNVLKLTLSNKYSDKFNIENDRFALYAEYVASGIISLYIEWFNTDSNITLEDLAQMASNITLNGVLSVLPAKS